MIPENEKPVTDITQPRKAENVVELGNAKSNGAEELEDKEVVSEYRNDGEDEDATKPFMNPGHSEETYPADSNLFGQGRTNLSMEKPGWKDPK